MLLDIRPPSRVIAPPSPSTLESLRTEIPYPILYRFIVTLDSSPQIAVAKSGAASNFEYIDMCRIILTREFLISSLNSIK